MKALVMKAFHEHVLAEMPIPRIERPDDVLIEIKAAGVAGPTSTDTRANRGAGPRPS